jgi:hypothetical protein
MVLSGVKDGAVRNQKNITRRSVANKAAISRFRNFPDAILLHDRSPNTAVIRDR